MINIYKINNQKGGILNILPNYYIVSSHNTYLTGHQLTDNSTYYMYIAFLNTFGGGCLEIDPVSVHDHVESTGNKIKDIIIKHGPLTGQIFLSKLLELIILWLDDEETIKTGPIILTFDNKYLKKRKEQDYIWDVFNRTIFKQSTKQYVFSNQILLEKTDIAYLKGKIIIRWDECTNPITKGTDEVCSKDGKTETKGLFNNNNNKSGVNISIPKVNLLTTKTEDKKVEMYTLIANNDIEPNEIVFNIINNTHNKLIRVYPHPLNIKSGNYDIAKYFASGVNCVALNFQVMDLYLIKLITFFGNTSIIKKPSYLTDFMNISEANYEKIYPKYVQVTLTIQSLHQQKLKICISGDVYNKVHKYRLSPNESCKVILAINKTFPIISISVDIYNINIVNICNSIDRYYGAFKIDGNAEFDVDCYKYDKKINCNGELMLLKDLYKCDNKHSDTYALYQFLKTQKLDMRKNEQGIKLKCSYTTTDTTDLPKYKKRMSANDTGEDQDTAAPIEISDEN